jgi:prepilin peptidase CpaA
MRCGHQFHAINPPISLSIMPDQILTLATALVLALLAVAVISDIRSHCIPNWVAGGILTLGALAQCATSGWTGPALAGAGAVVALLFFLPFYARHAMGAGDVKLMAAAGAWLGPVGAVLGCAVTLIAGVGLALLALACRLAPARVPALHAATHLIPSRVRTALVVERDGRLKVPYAAAIATGVLVSARYLDKLSPVTGLTH